MSDLQESFSFEEYRMEWYEQEEGPPLIKKKSRLIAAVVQNQVEVLQELLDSPEWYNVRDKWGYSLLQIAILCNNVAVFDCLLSIPQFPLEFVNKYNQTALVVALEGFVTNDIWIKEHFAYQLVEKGANFDRNSLTLHQALERKYFRVATLLIQKGVNVDGRDIYGNTPLELVIDYENVEVVMALLMNGAEPSIASFNKSVLTNLDTVVEETMFLLLFDEYSTIKIGWNVLVRLAQRNSQLFDELLKYPVQPPTRAAEIGTFIMSCLSIKRSSLRKILTKLSPDLSEASSVRMPSSGHCIITPEHLENLEVLLESDLRTPVISYIANLDTMGFFSQLVQKYNQPEIIKTYCYLLSYGLPLRERDLSQVYERYGYGETFKMFLHMEVDHSNLSSDCAWPLFLHSASMDFEEILQSGKNYTDLAIFLKYFRDPHVVNGINSKIGTRDPSRQKTTPGMPLLLELARNAFHKFLVKTFNVTTGRRFYTLVNCLDISPVYKKIITYETKLY